MTSTAIRRTVSAAIAVLLMAAGAAVSVAPAHADAEKDQIFIDYLDKKAGQSELARRLQASVRAGVDPDGNRELRQRRRTHLLPEALGVISAFVLLLLR